jgi:hypothetical protein
VPASKPQPPGHGKSPSNIGSAYVGSRHSKAGSAFKAIPVSRTTGRAGREGRGASKSPRSSLVATTQVDAATGFWPGCTGEYEEGEEGDACRRSDGRPLFERPAIGVGPRQHRHHSVRDVAGTRDAITNATRCARLGRCSPRRHPSSSGLVCSLRERTTRSSISCRFRAFRVGQFCRRDALAAQLGIGYGSLATGADMQSPNGRRLGGELNVALTSDVDEFEDRSVRPQQGSCGSRGSDRSSNSRRRYPHLRLVVFVATTICPPTPVLLRYATRAIEHGCSQRRSDEVNASPGVGPTRVVRAVLFAPLRWLQPAAGRTQFFRGRAAVHSADRPHRAVSPAAVVPQDGGAGIQLVFKTVAAAGRPALAMEESVNRLDVPSLGFLEDMTLRFGARVGPSSGSGTVQSQAPMVERETKRRPYRPRTPE